MEIRARSGKITLGALVVAVLAALMIVAPPAAANPNDVILDYRADGVIDGEHAPASLYEALLIWQQTGLPGYGAFDQAISEAVDQATLGIAPSNSAPPPSDGEQSANEIVRPAPEVAPAFAPLPAPPPAGESRPPLAFLALSALAGLLVIAGAGAAVTRRVRGRSS